MLHYCTLYSAAIIDTGVRVSVPAFIPSLQQDLILARSTIPHFDLSHLTL